MPIFSYTPALNTRILSFTDMDDSLEQVLPLNKYELRSQTPRSDEGSNNELSLADLDASPARSLRSCRSSMLSLASTMSTASR